VRRRPTCDDLRDGQEVFRGPVVGTGDPGRGWAFGGLGGAGISGWWSHRTTTGISRQEADERRRRQFLEERRAAYVRYLAALREWEPLRDRDWRLRAAVDEPSLTPSQRDDAMHRWQQSRELNEPSFRRLLEAEQEIAVLAPRRIRGLMTSLSVESSRRGKTGLLMEQFLQAVRLDLGADPDLRAAGSPTLEYPGAFQEGIPSAPPEDMS
jgi:hypothetical protein